MSFTRTLGGFRRVPTLRGDTLQSIAARELGATERWYQLIYLNKLSYPYITDDPAQAGEGVLLTGETIVLPASGRASQTVNPDNMYGDDIRLTKGMLGADAAGDMLIVSGTANLSQAIVNRLGTNRGELRFHLDYGCAVRQLLGAKGSPNALAAAGLVKRSLAADKRVRQVPSLTAVIRGDVVSINGTVEAVTGQQIQVSV